MLERLQTEGNAEVKRNENMEYKYNILLTRMDAGKLLRGLSTIKRGVIRLNLPSREQISAIRLLNAENRFITFHRSKVPDNQLWLNRLWADNIPLQNDIAEIFIRYGNINERVNNANFNDLMATVFNINNNGILMAEMNTEILNRLREASLLQQAPQWFQNIFINTVLPINVITESPSMGRSFMDAEITDSIILPMVNELVDIGLPVLISQELALRLIKYFEYNFDGNLARDRDYDKAIQNTIRQLFEEFDEIIIRARKRLEGGFTFNLHSLQNLITQTFNTYFRYRGQTFSIADSVQVFSTLFNQAITNVERNSIESKEEKEYKNDSAHEIIQRDNISPYELADVLKADIGDDVVYGYGIRVRMTNETPESKQEIKEEIKEESTDIFKNLDEATLKELNEYAEEQKNKIDLIKYYGLENKAKTKNQ